MSASRRAGRDSPWVRAILIALSLIFLSLFLFLPLIAVFVEALRDGVGAYPTAITAPDTLSEILLTLLTK